MANQQQVYKNYCQAIQLSTNLKGKELSEAIAEANRRCYKVLFNDRDIRQRNMSEQQLDTLAKHREMMTSVMMAKVQK